MSGKTKESLDGAVLSLNEEFVLMPVVAITEVIIYQKDTPAFIPSAQGNSPLLGKYIWRGLELPLIAINLEYVDIQMIAHPKVAIINAQFNVKPERPPYFAAIFENRPHKLRVRNADLSWLDRKAKKILLKSANEAYDMTLFDVHLYSQAVEELLTQIPE